MSRLRLTVGMSDYDHVRDLLSGVVPVEGLDFLPLDMPIEEIFHRFLSHREWDVSEISMAKYCALVSTGDESLVAIPVFPSRVFRHSSMYVCADSRIDDPAQLRGCRIGIPEWAQTAAVYSRALLVHEYGVGLHEVHWVQAGVNQAGRKEKVPLALPEGVVCTTEPDRSLTEMLLASDLDAVLSARPPECFEQGDGTVVRLVKDAHLAERSYRDREGIFPIMHTVVLRRELVDAHPWLPATLFKGFEEAKHRSLRRLRDANISRFPVPWLSAHLDDTSGGAPDPWPYGVEANRVTLEAFLGFAHEQGVLARPLRPEELFAPSLDGGFRI